MSSTLVIQSHTSPLPYPWLEACLQSVRQWSSNNRFDYRFVGDELFDFVAEDLLQKTAQQKVIATDLARLYAAQQALQQNYETVIWLDADTLVFDSRSFSLHDEQYAVGREVWLQQNEKGRTRVYTKVHNAFLQFRRDNRFLEFYIETAEKLLRKNSGAEGEQFTAPAQFIGPKLLTALHNVVQLPVQETAAMLSPLTVQALLSGNEALIGRYNKASYVSPCAVNLCSSSCDRGELTDSDMENVIELLLGQGFPSAYGDVL